MDGFYNWWDKPFWSASNMVILPAIKGNQKGGDTKGCIY